MTLGALALGPDDSCYDPNRPFYAPEFWNTETECQCMAAEGRPLGEQCMSFQGVVQTMTGQAGAVVGGAASAVGEGIGSGIATGASSLASNINLSGIALLAVAGFVAYALLSKR